MLLRARCFASGLFALALVVSVAHAGPAQEKHPSGAAATMTEAASVPAWLVGTWTLVRCDNVYPDGHRVELYGPHPQGLWMIDAKGHYLMHIARVQRTPFASGDKSKGTADEYRAASLDSNSHFGSIHVEDGRIVTHIDQASFPNWNGRDGKSSFTRDGNQLTYIVAKPSSGSGDGAHGEVVWQHVD
ncbi:lipocalin-like domain-containing protein [Dyella jiangningensis]|uniref:lipocalin-like domain-containing protein n=1 Tax=Dyella jiangningensis TaxID=1379159 RepID=UPI00240EFE33|nr:lipocalin-like domain-containing protein [Dyella jiangningensis]MDG2538424.1 lipocalin-like domain-containing protein [Dyella jiangningensis]